jgi:membrane associated rhomboid family serine protease
VKWLLIVTASVSVLDFILRSSRAGSFLPAVLALVPAQVVHSLAIWQLVTYMFLHAGITNVLWNLLALWMFGAELERTWGTRRFVTFYLACGIIAGVTSIIAAYVFGGVNFPLVGSSGAIYGILVAFGVLFPNQTILFGFLIPIKTKYFVLIIGAVIFLQSYMAIAGGQGAVAAIASLGGMVGGYVLLRGQTLQGRVRNPLVAGYQDWKLRRAKKKFEVYLRKKDSKRGPWVH